MRTRWAAFSPIKYPAYLIPPHICRNVASDIRNHILVLECPADSVLAVGGLIFRALQSVTGNDAHYLCRLIPRRDIRYIVRRFAAIQPCKDLVLRKSKEHGKLRVREPVPVMFIKDFTCASFSASDMPCSSLCCFYLGTYRSGNLYIASAANLASRVNVDNLEILVVGRTAVLKASIFGGEVIVIFAGAILEISTNRYANSRSKIGCRITFQP